MSKRSVGTAGEDVALDFLRHKGMKIIGRNMIRAGVEADIVAKDGRCVVVVEVKTKYGLEYGLPQEMVHPWKQRQLRRFAKSWLAQYGECAIRIDVVAVTFGDGEPQIEYLQNVVEG